MDDTPAAPTLPGPHRDDASTRRRLSLALAGTTGVVVSLDQVTKYLAVAHLQENVPVPLVDGILQLRLIRNPGAAFSLSTGTTWLFTLIAVVVSIVIVRVSRRLGSLGWAIALGLLLGGAVGNLIDRLLRAPGFAVGHVVDFIEYLKFPFISFPVFNVADSAITCAAALITVLGFLDIPLDGRAATADPASGSDEP